MSLSNDELGGVNTPNLFESVGEIVEEARYHHAHPIGYRVFMYYWVGVVGDSPLIVRLPFVIFGILALPLVYLLTNRWFNRYSAVLATCWLGVLAYPVHLSQVARPYAAGLFFSLLTVYCWTLLLFDRSKQRSLVTYLGFIAGAVMALYWHYFSGLLVGIVGLTGLFFLSWKNYKYYLAAGVAIILLFAPHLSITWDQLTVKQGLTWLPAPGKMFVFK
jgi:uncharacterized membrane protein